MEFRPGFRFSAVDVVILIIGAGGSMVAHLAGSPLCFALAFNIGHFFLFCNVFRLPRSLELIWATCFVCLEGSRLAVGSPSLFAVISITTLVTIIVVFVQCRKASYHGLLWSKINPDLRSWFDQKKAGDHR